MKTNSIVSGFQRSKALTGFLALAMTVLTSIPFGFADEAIKEDVRSLTRHPIAKQAAIGAGIGALTGAVSDESSLLKGAGVGALVGAGTGLLDTSQTLQNKPLLRTTAKGAIIGTGASTVLGESKLKGAVVGAGAGAGLQLLKDYLNNDDY